ncbi:ParB N-terminal domain-containing protein [Streptomyces sp. NPDC004610]|uniref:ParB N-terminal domain-containing protein n=1 Tax=unclassified Streptomyces TaxID=2593676 RepID=UPI00339DB471
MQQQHDDAPTAVPAPVLKESHNSSIPRHPLEPEKDVVAVAISALLLGESPRIEGQDREHIIRLAETENTLPPIVVNKRTMQVIDGVHRVFAAILRGEETIRAIFFDGSTEDAFLCAVQANMAHGLPLSLADRRAAAERIVVSHSQISDRAIARATGLGAKTVAALRRQLALSAPHVQARVGIDGKARPLNSAAGRLRAAQVIAARPQASLREVARLAGISPATASDVKRRLAGGKPPVGTLPSTEPDTHTRPVAAETIQPRTQRRTVPEPLDPGHTLEKLTRDPSLRQNQIGRELLRLLHHNAIVMKEWPELVSAVPEHCTRSTADLARQYAESWVRFEERVRAAG